MNDESEASVDYWTGKDIYAIYDKSDLTLHFSMQTIIQLSVILAWDCLMKWVAFALFY